MAHKENLFREFPETTASEWIEKVEKDLKGKAFEELFWTINDEIKIAPFYYSIEDRPSVPKNKINSNTWEIGEDIFVESPKLANQQLLKALTGGVNAPRIVADSILDAAQMAIIFKNVELGFISVHFLIKKANSTLPTLENFQNYLSKNNIDSDRIKGSINHNDKEQLAELIKFVIEKLPNFKINTINVKATPIAKISRSLAQAISKGNEYLAILEKNGIAPETANNHLQFSVSVGSSYFIEIAKIRALKILWANILEAYGTRNAKIPDIEVHLSSDAFGDNPNTNMIHGTTQAMSAVLGGANRLTVLPADAKNGKSTDFSKRIARNVQHLLSMESFLDRVIDPASGSYYIEKLTEKIAEAAWLEFQKMEIKTIQ
jgi:methylmalonyl-CoA mutase